MKKIIISAIVAMAITATTTVNAETRISNNTRTLCNTVTLPGGKTIKNDPMLTRVKNMGFSGYDKITVELTGYCNCSICSDNWASMTASGETTRHGVIAAPVEIPLYTDIIIDGYSTVYTVLDRGGAIYTYDNGVMAIDMWFPSHEEALATGRSTKDAYILY